MPPDRPVRASELRAAARTPAEIADALTREARVRKKRALKVTRTPPAVTGAAGPSAALAPRPANTAPPNPAPANAAPAYAAPAHAAQQGVAPIPPPLVAQASPSSVAPSPPVPAPPHAAPSPPRSIPATPSALRTAASAPPAPPPAPRPAPARVPRSRTPLLIAAVLALQGGALAWLAYSTARLGQAIDRPAPASRTESAAPQPAVSGPATAPAATAPAALMPAIATLGEGRLVYASPDGKLVLMGRDHVSGELVVERVYSLEKDELRNLGDDARRAYAGYYLVDVERVRRQNVAVQEGLFNDAAAKAAERTDGLDRCIEAARWLADAGGVDKLRKRLDDRNNFARHAAALALGERGYLAAIPGLITIVEGTGDTELARRVILILRDLTGLPLERDDGRTTVARRADEWWKKNAPEDPYARRVPPPR